MEVCARRPPVTCRRYWDARAAADKQMPFLLYSDAPKPISTDTAICRPIAAIFILRTDLSMRCTSSDS